MKSILLVALLTFAAPTPLSSAQSSTETFSWRRTLGYQNAMIKTGFLPMLRTLIFAMLSGSSVGANQTLPSSPGRCLSPAAAAAADLLAANFDDHQFVFIIPSFPIISGQCGRDMGAAINGFEHILMTSRGDAFALERQKRDW